MTLLTNYEKRILTALIDLLAAFISSNSFFFFVNTETLLLISSFVNKRLTLLVCIYITKTVFGKFQLQNFCLKPIT